MCYKRSRIGKSFRRCGVYRYIEREREKERDERLSKRMSQGPIVSNNCGLRRERVWTEFAYSLSQSQPVAPRAWYYVLHPTIFLMLTVEPIIYQYLLYSTSQLQQSTLHSSLDIIDVRLSVYIYTSMQYSMMTSYRWRSSMHSSLYSGTTLVVEMTIMLYSWNIEPFSRRRVIIMREVVVARCPISCWTADGRRAACDRTHIVFVDQKSLVTLQWDFSNILVK